MTKNHAEAWVRRTFSEFKEVYLELLKTKSITKEDLENLLAVEHKIPPIYFLPKIHKSHNSESGSFVGRPIISACSSVWKPADLLITQITRFLLHDVPGSLINTTALLNRIEELDDPTENTILFSADVVALNPSIPTNEGIIACWSYYINNFTKISDYCERNNWLPPPNPETFRKTHPPGGGGKLKLSGCRSQEGPHPHGGSGQQAESGGDHLHRNPRHGVPEHTHQATPR